jgi:hypothetical protein
MEVRFGGVEGPKPLKVLIVRGSMPKEVEERSLAVVRRVSRRRARRRRGRVRVECVVGWMCIVR